MNEPSEKVNFLAVLIYEDGPGRCCEEPRVYSATHPEIAYQLALADGNEQRYGRRFLGLSRLDETNEEVEPIACSRQGDASELVVSKEELTAFSDPRWKERTCNQAELADALREPLLLFEIDGLNSMPWHQFAHAYGIASEVPKDIRRLASSDPEVREQALWQLFGSIYHQGTIYSATAAAVPFLLRLAFNHKTPDRAKLWELLHVIAESSAIDPEKIRQTWAWRRKNFGELYAKPSEEMAENEIANKTAVRSIFADYTELIRSARSDSDADVSRHATAIIRHLECAHEGN